MKSLAPARASSQSSSVAPRVGHAPSPVHSEHAAVIELQREAGNRAVTGLLAELGAPTVQRNPPAGSTLAPPSAGSSSSSAGQPSAGGSTPAFDPAHPVTTTPSTSTPPSSSSTAVTPAPRLDAPKSPETLVLEANSEWTSVKTRHKNDIPTMTSLVRFRKTEVDALLTQMKAKHGVDARSAGSDALTSDYDITFLGSGKAAAAAVSEFNKLFGDKWHKESGTVFDTNVYAEDFLGAKPTNGVRDDDATKMDPETASREAAMQDVNSLVKVRKNMTTTDWAAFVERVIATLPESGSIRAETRKQFELANSVFTDTYVAAMIDQLEKDENGKAQVAKLRDADPGITDQMVVETLETKAEGVRSANRIYEEKLKEVGRIEALRAKVKTNKEQWSEFTLLIRKAKSEAMLFANEPYFSAGTLYHVVGNIQQAWGTDLGTAEYFQSANENFGDFKKEIVHSHHGASHGNEKANFLNFAVQSSKYAYRFFDAAAQLRKKGVVFTSDVEASANLEGRLLAIRQGETLNAAGNRNDEKAIGAKRDEGGTLRYKAGATGGAEGTAVAVSKDYRAMAPDKKLEDAEAVTNAMGVTSIGTLDDLLTKVSVEVNGATRKAGAHRPPS